MVFPMVPRTVATQELTILEALELKFKPGTSTRAIAQTRRIQTEHGVRLRAKEGHIDAYSSDKPVCR